MNAPRRAKLQDLEDRLGVIVEELQQVLSEEQEAFDNRPESLQSGDRADAITSAIETLESAKDDLENIIPQLAEGRGESA